MSSTWALCVSQPAEMRSTPLAAMAVAVAGVMRPDAGAIVIDGIDAVADPEAAKPYLSYMPQRFGLYEELTVDENIRFYADLFEVPPALRRERAARLLAASGMANFGRFKAGTLSGGMKQKLGLTCALVHTPKVLLLDEPTTGVDPVSRREFWKLLSQFLATGITILMSTPYLDEAERCSHIALLHEGRLLAFIGVRSQRQTAWVTARTARR